MRDPITSQELLNRRIAHYRFNYAGERLRARLIEDGFAPEDVDQALLEAENSSPRDVYDASAPPPDVHGSPLVALPVTLGTAAVIAVINGVIPWAPIMLGGRVLIGLPFAVLSAFELVELYAAVKARYDYPNVSRGIIAGMIAGAILCFVVMSRLNLHVR